MNCDACGKALIPGKKFCGGCGVTIATKPETSSSSSSASTSGTPACHACGKDLVPGKKFCGGCGETIPTSAPAPSSSPSSSSSAALCTCGVKLDLSRRFCGTCGTPTADVKTGGGGKPASSAETTSKTQLNFGGGGGHTKKDVSGMGNKIKLNNCPKCGQTAYETESVKFGEDWWHTKCFACTACSTQLTLQRAVPTDEGLMCKVCSVPVLLKRVKKGEQDSNAVTSSAAEGVAARIKLETCPICKTTAHSTESLKFGEETYHESCFKCQQCTCILTIQRATLIDGQGLFCTVCAKPKLLAKGLEKQKNVNLDMGATLTSVAKNACPVCAKTAYEAESFKYNERMYHPACFKCTECAAVLDQRTVNQEEDDKSGPIWCKQCFHKNIIAKKKVVANTAKTTASTNPLAAKFGTNQKCPQCEKTAYKEESESLNGVLYHKACMQCKTCGCSLNLRLLTVYEGLLYCKKCQHHLVAFAKIDMVAHPKAFEEHMRAAGIHDYTAKGGTGTLVSSTLPSNASEKPAPQPKPVSDDPPAAPVPVYKSNPGSSPPAALQKSAAKINSPFLQKDQGGPASFNNSASEPANNKKPDYNKQASVAKMDSPAACAECNEEYDPPDARFCMICGCPRPDSSPSPAPAAKPAAATPAPKSPAVKPMPVPVVKEPAGPPPKATPTQAELDARPRYEGKVDPSRQGLMIKAKTAKGKDQVRGGWQPRFFILNSDDKSLAYFTGGGAYGPPAGIVRLEGAECAPTMAVPKKETLAFKITEQNPLKFYYIACESERIRDDWVASIRHAIDS